jgi:hypothetical protein
LVATVIVWGPWAQFTKRFSVHLKLALLLVLIIPAMAHAQTPTPGQNVNMVSGTKWPDGDPYLQRQNESSIAVSSRNACHLLAGANDYRSVDLNFFATGETGDAWLGLFKSFDCGATWQSTLFPGYHLDQTPEGKSSPLKPWNAASDPVVRSGPSGFFGYSGIAFNRGTNNGVVFFGRLVDLNNKENGTAATGAANTNTDAIRFVGTSVVATGTARRFLDKPWMAIDVSRHGSGCTLPVPLPGGGSVNQSVAVGNIYIAFTAFNYNQMGTLTSSQILLSRSADCGATWSRPITLSAADDDDGSNILNQGATIAIDPQTGFVYVAWRRFATPHHPDAIVAAASISGGQWFTPAVPVITLPKFDPSNPPIRAGGPFSFFDQGTTGSSMRMDAFPSLAVADSGKPGIPGQIYLAWAQRGVGPNGEARIMLAGSPNSVHWVPPFPVDNGSVLDDLGNLFANGHQFSPQLTFSGGKLVALYYDLRFEDHTIGTFDAVSSFPLPDSLGRFVKQTRNPCSFSLMGVSLCNGDPLKQVVTPYLDDAGLTGRRHTLGVSMAQFDPQTSTFGPGAFKTAQVSQFPFGTRGDGTSFLQQLEFNVPNLPLFMGGTAPFLGDYLDIAGPMFALKNGSWVYSTGPSSASAFHATWTDNRDVKPPLDGDWTKYAPVNLDGPAQSVFDPTQTRQSCMLGPDLNSLQHEGERNQNIYTSLITQGLRVSSPQDSKQLSTTLQRAFVVFVQNFTNSDRIFRLVISSPQPPGGFASFVAGKNNPPNSPTPPNPISTSLDVTVAAQSGVVRSVFAVSSQTAASITVTATEISGIGGNAVPGGLSSFVVLNPDPQNPALTNPDGAPASSDINTVEIYEPNLHTPNLHTDNITDPNLHTPNLHTDTIPAAGVANTVATPTNLTNIFNLDIATPNLHTPNLHTAGIAAPNLHTPNLHTLAPSSAMTDATYVFSNTGNTAASYHVRLVGNDPGTDIQVIVTNYYVTPVASNCQLALQPAHSVLANAVKAVVQSPANFNPADTGITDGSTGNVTFTVPPGGIVLVTMRANVDENTMQNSILSQVLPVVVPHAANTNDATNTPKTAAPPPVIITAALPDGVNGTPYNATVQAVGGTLPYTWTISAGSLPPGLIFNELGPGKISGSSETVAGTYTFSVQVRDSAPTPNTATKELRIRIADPLRISTNTSLAGTVNAPFTANLTSTGGIAPITWSGSGLPSWLNLTPAGVLSGTAPTTGTFSFTAIVSDSGSPSQTASQLMALSLVSPPPPPTNVARGTVSPNSATIIWEFSTGNVIGYNVYRSIVSGSGYSLIGSVSSTAFSFTDTTVVSGTTYYYVVTAVGPGNVQSVFSNEVSVPVPNVSAVFFGQAIDPLGDAGGGPDLVWAGVTTYNSNTVKLSVRFASGTFSAAYTAAQFSLDTDQSVATGHKGSDSGCSTDSTVIGTDYLVNLDSGYANNTATIFKYGGACNNFVSTGSAPVTIFADGMDVTFPLSMLTNTASAGVSGPATLGPWNFKVVSYSKYPTSPGFTGVQDRMPDVGSVAFTASSPLPITPPSGMLAWWPADGYPTDIQGGHGMLISSGVGFAPSEVGQSFGFDGMTGYITVTDTGDLRPAAVTVDFWFKSNINLPDLNHPEIPLIMKLNPFDDANGASKGYDFFYQFGAIGFGLPSTPGGFRTIVYSTDGSTAITAGTWHHVAGTYDSSGQKLYLDGILVNSGAYFGPIQYQPAALQFGTVFNTANFGAGGNPNHTYYFNGQLDEIEIHNRALSASEIQAIFNAGSAGKAKP